MVGDCEADNLLFVLQVETLLADIEVEKYDNISNKIDDFFVNKFAHLFILIHLTR